VLTIVSNSERLIQIRSMSPYSEIAFLQGTFKNMEVIGVQYESTLPGQCLVTSVHKFL
jgi:hypothetical protein